MERDAEQIRALLLAKKQQLLDALTQGTGASYRMDWAAQVGAIDYALRRRERGKYGTCVECRAPVEAERLQAVIEEPRCLLCDEEVRGLTCH